MKCPSCGKEQTFVVLSHMDKTHGKIRIRKFRCDICGQFFYTGEVYITPKLEDQTEKEKTNADN